MEVLVAAAHDGVQLCDVYGGGGVHCTFRRQHGGRVYLCQRSRVCDSVYTRQLRLMQPRERTTADTPRPNSAASHLKNIRSIKNPGHVLAERPVERERCVAGRTLLHHFKHALHLLG